MNLAQSPAATTQYSSGNQARVFAFSRPDKPASSYLSRPFRQQLTPNSGTSFDSSKFLAILTLSFSLPSTEAQAKWSAQLPPNEKPSECSEPSPLKQLCQQLVKSWVKICINWPSVDAARSGCSLPDGNKLQER